MTDSSSSADGEAPVSPSATPEETALDIHKPKPVHSFRELLTEIGVIVIGVAIALSGEQAVEWLHWRAEVADTRAALTSELSSAVEVIQATRRIVPCEAATLDAYAAWASGARATNPSYEVSGQGLPALQTSAWEVAKAGQDAAHIPLQARLDYARLYDNIAQVNEMVSGQRQIWTNLAAYVDKTTLTEEDRRRLTENVSQARLVRKIWETSAPLILSGAEKLGVKRNPDPPLARVPDDCQSVLSAAKTVVKSSPP